MNNHTTQTKSINHNKVSITYQSKYSIPVTVNIYYIQYVLLYRMNIDKRHFPMLRENEKAKRAMAQSNPI